MEDESKEESPGLRSLAVAAVSQEEVAHAPTGPLASGLKSTSNDMEVDSTSVQDEGVDTGVKDMESHDIEGKTESKEMEVDSNPIPIELPQPPMVDMIGVEPVAPPIEKSILLESSSDVQMQDLDTTDVHTISSVSYTHLTLPTICSV